MLKPFWPILDSRRLSIWSKGDLRAGNIFYTVSEHLAFPQKWMGFIMLLALYYLISAFNLLHYSSDSDTMFCAKCNCRIPIDGLNLIFDNIQLETCLLLRSISFSLVHAWHFNLLWKFVQDIKGELMWNCVHYWSYMWNFMNLLLVSSWNASQNLRERDRENFFPAWQPNEND